MKIHYFLNSNFQISEIFFDLVCFLQLFYSVHP